MQEEDQTKVKLRHLLYEERRIQSEMKDIVRQYLVSVKHMPTGLDKEDFAYRKVLREEFGLVA
jgi:hypothetical protein